MSELEALRKTKPDKPLFHYTTQQGLLGIVRSRSLWASSTFHLNDSAEFHYFIALITRLLKQKLKDERGPWNDLYGYLLEEFPRLAEFDIFVACFSEEPDLLSQWRGYGIDSPGFCIGLSADKLGQKAVEQDFRLMRCVYEPVAQQRVCEEMISKACRAAESSRIDTERFNLLWEVFQPLFLEFIPALKHSSFAEEREWRLIRGPLPFESMEFRPGKRGLIPYCDFGLAGEGEPLEFERLIIGPSQDPQAAQSSARAFLASTFTYCVDVVTSRVTYRS